MSVDLQRRPLGSTGFVVHPICLGCASLGDMPETFAYSVPEGSALETVRAFFASELNFIDTANVYGFGESERRIGIVVREMGALPVGFVLSTKLDRERGTNRFDGARARASIEESRQRLGLDRLQLVYLHDFEYCDQDEILGPGGALEVLRQYQADGIVEHIGLAAGPIPEMIRYLDHASFEAVITHNRYTLLNREAEPLIAECQRRGIALVNAAPYGSGMLAKGPSAYPRYMYKDAPAELVERALKLEAVCQRWNVPLAAAALQFSLRDPRVAATIVGMTKPERIEETLTLTRVDVPEAIWAELDQAAGFA